MIGLLLLHHWEAMVHLTELKSVVRIESYLAVEIKESQHSYEIVVDAVAAVISVAAAVAAVVECSVSWTQTSFAVYVESSAVAASVTAEAAAKIDASVDIVLSK